MRDYGAFVGAGESRWEAFRQRLAAFRRAPRRVGYDGLEGLALDYRRILQDHAYAAARFPGTMAARRLAALALEATHHLQGEEPARRSGLGHFLLVSFPAAFRRTASSVALASFLFFVAALFGFGLAIAETSLAVTLMGPRTVEDLREGNLWTESLLRAVPASVSSSSIARNNITVAITGWAGGALAGAGSLYVLFFNGFLLGSVFGVTAHYGMAGRLGEFVAAHGPLEITLILVCCGAGLSVGRALVEAGDRPRGEALAAAGKDALRVLLGCLPWFVVLGFVEGFVSPSAAVPVSVKAGLGLALLALFLFSATNPMRTDPTEER